MASSTRTSSDAARPDIAELRFLLQAHGRAAMFLNEKPPSILHCRWREIVMMTRRQFNATASAALLVPSVVATLGARAAAWPTRVVRIVPFAAGGPTDVIGRIVAEQLSKSWGQQVVIENRPGGGTNIANEIVAHSEPDGHTVLMGGSRKRRHELSTIRSTTIPSVILLLLLSSAATRSSCSCPTRFR